MLSSFYNGEVEIFFNRDVALEVDGKINYTRRSFPIKHKPPIVDITG